MLSLCLTIRTPLVAMWPKATDYNQVRLSPYSCSWTTAKGSGEGKATEGAAQHQKQTSPSTHTQAHTHTSHFAGKPLAGYV